MKVSIVIVARLLFALLLVWCFNTMFGLAIPYTIWTVLAAYFLSRPFIDADAIKEYLRS